MKVQVLKNASGQILAAFDRSPGAQVSIAAEPGQAESIQDADVSELSKTRSGLTGIASQTFGPAKVKTLRGSNGKPLAAALQTPGESISIEPEPGEKERLDEELPDRKGQLPELLDMLLQAHE
jgi:hypothetical protein